MFGTDANRPPIAMVDIGTLYTATDTLIIYEAIVGITGTKSWLIAGGSGAITGDLSKYWVAPATSIPVAPYNLPSAAIAAAVADGHTTGTPAAVFIWPGTYNDNVVLTSGIDLVGFGGWNCPEPQNGVATATPNMDVVINGNMTLSATFTRCSVRGIRFTSASNTLDMGASTTVTNLVFQNCRLESSASSCITGASTNTPSLFLDNTTLLSTFATAKALNLTTTANVFASRTKISASVGSDTAMSLAGGTHIFQSCKFLGLIVYTAPAGGDSYEHCDLTVTAASAITLVAGTIVTWLRGSILGATAGSTIAGTGTIDFVGVRTDANGIGLSIVGVITATEDGTIRKYDQNDLGAASPTLAPGILHEQYTVDTSAAGRTITLMAIATIPIGRRVRIAAGVGGAQTITVTPAGAELINGVAAPVVTAALVRASIGLVRGTTGWLTDGTS